VRRGYWRHARLISSSLSLAALISIWQNFAERRQHAQ
jgi:hypothetical protein